MIAHTNRFRVSGIFLLLLFSPAFLQAQHARGGEITYSCQGGLEYQFQLTIWADSITNTIAVNDTLYVDFGDGNTLTLLTTDAQQCNNLATSLPSGYSQINQLRWTLVHTYSNPGGPGGYPVSAAFTGRIPAISNISNSEGSTIYLHASVYADPSIGTNSCPFSSSVSAYLFFPVLSQSNYFAFNYSDPDGDSLSFSFLPSAATGYTFPDIAGGGTLSIDAVTGLVSWNNPNQQGVYNVTVRIEQWKSFSGTPVLVGLADQEIEFVVDVSNGIEENNAPAFSVFPNPASGQLNLEFDASGNCATILIVNSLGQIVFEKPVENAGKKMRMRLDVSALDAGIYTVIIREEEKMPVARKIILQR